MAKQDGLARLTVQIFTALSILALSGCGTFGYYTQAVGGQWSLIQGREPIADLLAAPDTAPDLRQRLARIGAIRKFARDHLALPVGKTYSGYVALDRDYVVWNVLAAPPDSLDLKTWCYPVVGCQSYRGYFEARKARQLARQLEQQGWETWAPGVIAYSSLGWFDDPVLSTFSHWPEDSLAALIFHELSHKAVYIDGDTRFNESYATAVELEGLLRYLEHYGQPGDFGAALERQQMEREFTDLVMATAAELRKLYTNPDLAKAEIASSKAQLFSQLQTNYHSRRQHWPNPKAYAYFFGPGLNNARIASVGTYNRWVPAFRQLLRENDGDFGSFHGAVRQLSELPQEERERELMALEGRSDEGNSTQASGSRQSGENTFAAGSTESAEK